MDTKQEARDLFNQHHKICRCTIAGTSTIFIDIAKSAAILTVNKILSQISPINKGAREQWEEVIDEINKIQSA